MNTVLAYLDTGDRRVSGRIESWNPPRWFRVWMLFATWLGDGWLWALIAALLLAIGDYRVFFAAGLACSAANAVLVVLKKKYRRSRPRANAPNHFFQIVRADLSAFDSFSFPSGHTMNAFAIGAVLSSMHPALFPAMLFVAMSVAASRLVLRLHYLTDVLAGAALGVMIARLVVVGMGS